MQVEVAVVAEGLVVDLTVRRQAFLVLAHRDNGLWQDLLGGLGWLCRARWQRGRRTCFNHDMILSLLKNYRRLIN